MPLHVYMSPDVSRVSRNVGHLFDAMFGCTHWRNPQSLRGVSTLLDYAHDRTAKPVLSKNILYLTNSC